MTNRAGAFGRIPCLHADDSTVKAYFIIGFPGETHEDIDAAVRHVPDLWDTADSNR